jgi:hypothetical protein
MSSSEGVTQDEVVAWMFALLLDRVGEPSPAMRMNDIAFHLHELCSKSPSYVTRMLDAGHAELALMTATEEWGAVPGMADPLHQLAKHANPLVADAAAAHLQRFYADSVG